MNKSYDQIVAPLEKIKEDLMELQERNNADVKANLEKIERLNQESDEKLAENVRASSTFQKIANLLE